MRIREVEGLWKVLDPDTELRVVDVETGATLPVEGVKFELNNNAVVLSVVT